MQMQRAYLTLVLPWRCTVMHPETDPIIARAPCWIGGSDVSNYM